MTGLPDAPAVVEGAEEAPPAKSQAPGRRPLDSAELASIADWLARHEPTRAGVGLGNWHAHRRPNKHRQCAHCGDSFAHRHGRQRYCSEKCKNKAQYQRDLARAAGGQAASVERTGA